MQKTALISQVKLILLCMRMKQENIHGEFVLFAVTVLEASATCRQQSN